MPFIEGNLEIMFIVHRKNKSSYLLPRNEKILLKSGELHVLELSWDLFVTDYQAIGPKFPNTTYYFLGEASQLIYHIQVKTAKSK